MTDLRFCDLLDEAAGRFGSAGIEGPRRDARRLLEAAAAEGLRLSQSFSTAYMAWRFSGIDSFSSAF